MNPMILSTPDFMISNQKTNTRQGMNQNSGFRDLLMRQAGQASSSISIPTQRNEKSQLDKTYRQLKELLPDEVLDILQENDGLQEEILTLVMQSLASQQEVSMEDNNEQQKLLIQKLLKQHLSPLEEKADIQRAVDIYNEIVNLLLGIDEMAAIDDTASLLADLKQDWDQFFQENPEMDKKEVLDDIQQHMQTSDSFMVGQTVTQMAYQLLDANLPEETEANDGVNAKAIEVNKALQNLNQFISRADSVTAEQMLKQIADIFVESDLMEEQLLKDIGSNAGQAANQPAEDNRQARIQQLMQVISQQMEKADPTVAEQAVKQIMKQLQGWKLAEEIQIQPKKATLIEGSQRTEARIATWLQTVFKEVSPGVIKQNGAVNFTDQTEAQSVNAASEAAQRAEPKMAAWLQTSYQDVSPAVLKHESLPISRVEQFIVNMGQTDSAKGLSGKELIDKIESLVQSQRLYSFVRGQNPISIQLRPENLGDMTIRFVQTNGELTVQMLVSSKAVKEVLESNLHQLRNVFSPHQVTIEKQDNVMLSNGTDASKNSKENPNDQQQADHYEESSESNEQEQYSETESFESFMEKLLAQNEEEQIQG
ncbi:flagellar hook-length control protein FliK [Oceanobacillus neutriphilus]|uniref:Flagellar hook-length control protein-like C-terminal domain-containing protein n=1 Tax=Oceanobacillus neutriphilus TaxID=531815 RepID=A0ABQ2NWL0_9BACI|nr:flagellar hook-length control protein FliK [Oceanobacillus neutriphilus]GGP12373.1 hypothetical protein GCM10011346_28080 [Oceanobacillus neutriphilus]